MALANNTLPSNLPSRAVPLDLNLLFAQAQTFTATGYLNNGASTTQANVGGGRIDGYWVLDLFTLKVSSGNETYQFALLGSNDSSFGNGNGELLAFHDFASATAGRVIPSLLLGASPAVPLSPSAATRHVFPYTNHIGGFILQYIQVYLTVGGTSPSVKCSSWLTPTTGAGGSG